MLTKMKSELDRYKTSNAKLEEELSQARSATNGGSGDWEAERSAMQTELSNTHDNMKTTVGRLESQLSKLQSEIAYVREEAEAALKERQQAEATSEQSRLDLETLRRQHAQTEERAREAESRVQMFLDQFESSVDNYRRQSQVPVGPTTNGEPVRGHRTHDSIASENSLYSDDETSTPDANTRSGSAATRNSMALDNLASELDALRSHWETTNKAYRLSDRFEFERTPSTSQDENTETMSQWKKQMKAEDEAQAGASTNQARPPQSEAPKATA